MYEGEQSSGKPRPPSWDEIRTFLEDICLDLPYTLHLQHIKDGQSTESRLDPKPLSVVLPTGQESLYLRIPFDDKDTGLEGEVVLLNRWAARIRQDELAQRVPTSVVRTERDYRGIYFARRPANWNNSSLLRGGLKVATVPGLPRSEDDFAVVRMTWRNQQNRRYARTNLARNTTVNSRIISDSIRRGWITHLVRNRNGLTEGQLYKIDGFGLFLASATWLEEFDALTLYETARDAWCKECALELTILEPWEDGVGPPMEFYPGKFFENTLAQQLLNLVLPIVIRLHIGISRYSVHSLLMEPPKPGWRDQLKACTNFIRQPRRWDCWIAYEGSLEHLLLYSEPSPYSPRGFLNVHFRDRVSSLFSEEELNDLLDVIIEWDHVRRTTKQLVLLRGQLAILLRAREAIGDLMVGTPVESWRIDSIPLPQGPRT